MTNAGDIVAAVSGIIVTVLGLAVVAVLVSNKAATAGVIGTTGSALANVIGAAVSPVTGASLAVHTGQDGAAGAGSPGAGYGPSNAFGGGSGFLDPSQILTGASSLGGALGTIFAGGGGGPVSAIPALGTI